jgi:hypothetical protein
MAVWAWLLVAVAVSSVAGLEAWAWMRHSQSAILMAAAGAISLTFGLIGVALVLLIGYGFLAGLSGWDPAGAFEDTGRAAAADGRACDPNYEGDCLDPDASDYDCAAGDGDGPLYSGPVTVVGDDPHDLDRDGNGYGCE